MNKDWILTQEAFDTLLGWLHSDREAAGRRYEEIRRCLIKIFACRGCSDPEDLADETINRVSKRLKDIKSTYSGDPARYFYGVANKVHLETIKLKRVSVPPPPPAPSAQETEYECLDRCMRQLTPNNRELVLQYYQQEKRNKIDHRRNLADQLGIAINALRIRAHRIRASLQDCVQNCLDEAT